MPAGAKQAEQVREEVPGLSNVCSSSHKWHISNTYAPTHPCPILTPRTPRHTALHPTETPRHTRHTRHTCHTYPTTVQTEPLASCSHAADSATVLNPRTSACSGWALRAKLPNRRSLTVLTSRRPDSAASLSEPADHAPATSTFSTRPHACAQSRASAAARASADTRIAAHQLLNASSPRPAAASHPSE
jgi:hypothetical protein